MNFSKFLSRGFDPQCEDSSPIRFRDLRSHKIHIKQAANLHQPMPKKAAKIHWPEKISNRELGIKNRGRMHPDRDRQAQVELDWPHLQLRKPKSDRQAGTGMESTG